MKLNVQRCSCCGEIKKLDNYYSTSSYFMRLTGRVTTCKDCIWTFVDVEDDILDLSRIKAALRMMDKPYMHDLWFASASEAEARNGNTFKFYMKNLGMKQYRELSWDDSQFYAQKEENVEKEFASYSDDVDMEIGIDASDLKRLNRTWGKFSVPDYVFLENFYGEYKNNFPTDTPAQVNIYKNLAKIHLQAEKELAKGNIKGYKDLMDLSSKMHTDGNIKPMQSSGMNDDKGLSTYGLWIKTIENDEPCEYFEDKPIYEDFDRFKKYIEKWFVRPFKNIFNLSKDFDVGDDK